MKVIDIIRKADEETVAKIIGSVIVMNTEKITMKEAMNMDYPNTLKYLQSDMDIDYKPTNADRIRAMSDKELTEFLNNIHEPELDEIVIDGKRFFEEDEIFKWLQSECD